MYKLAIFDFDGTLADSAPYFRTVLNQLARRHGFRELAADEMEAMRGVDSRSLLREMRIPPWKLPVIVADARRLVAADPTRTPLFPAAAAMLRALAAGGVEVAVLSSNSDANVRRVLGAAEPLVRWYACGASMFGKPAKFRALLKRSGAPPQAVIAIGDETRDLEAARAAGVTGAGVAWGVHTAELLRAHGAAVVFERFEDIAPRLTGASGAA